jgi:glucosamine--fructose-6-phosphate aminotransferase (isomerizing)
MWHLNRNSHPYAMHDGIMAEPGAFGAVVSRAAEQLRALSRLLSDVREIFVVGASTSLYAGQFAEYLSWEVLKEQRLRVLSSIDFVNFCPLLPPSSLGICVSHRGTEWYTSLAVERFVKQGVGCVYVVGENANLTHLPAQGFEVLETTPQEQSPAHTWSYVGSMAVLCAVLQSFNPDHPLLTPSLLQTEVPDALRIMQCSERLMCKLAEECTRARKIWIIGSGSDAVIAREVALKIVETSYLVAQGYDLEEAIQGPLQGAETTDVFILLNLCGRLTERMNSLVVALEHFKIRPIIFSWARAGESDEPTQAVVNQVGTWISLPKKLPYPYSSLQALIPLQFFAYYLAMACGRHPDSFRLDEESYRLGRQKLKG